MKQVRWVYQGPWIILKHILLFLFSPAVVLFGMREDESNGWLLSIAFGFLGPGIFAESLIEDIFGAHNRANQGDSWTWLTLVFDLSLSLIYWAGWLYCLSYIAGLVSSWF